MPEVTKEELRSEWVKALRSGEYEQSQSVLRDDVGFCCLGVACDVYSNLTGRGEWNERATGDFVFVLDENTESSASLVDEVRTAYGLHSAAGAFDRAMLKNKPLLPHADALTNLNDFENGLNFDQIADFIESEPEAVFS